MHQWIGSLSHDLQGVIHLNMHLHFWFPDEGFPTQYRHRQCSFYRVCLTCEQRKPCARCKEKKCATEYTSSAWKARNADRRICRACATKSRGSWTCRTCRQVLPHQSFTAFRRRRPSGQDGTQVCDKCLQATVIKPIAAMAALRLSRSRQRERNKKIWNEVQREIAAMVSARTRAGEAYPEPAPKRPRCEAGRDNEPFSEAAPEPGRPPTPAGPKSVYTCPYCKTAVQSTVQNGTVFTRNHCGKQFRVKDGQVIRSYQHACPHCGATRCRTASRAKQRNGRRPAKTCQDTRHDAPPVAKTQRHAAHKKCLTSLSEALKEEVTAPHHPRKERNVAV